jgi:hypothetical protein
MNATDSGPWPRETALARNRAVVSARESDVIVRTSLPARTDTSAY